MFTPAEFLPAPRMSADLAKRYRLGILFPGQAYHLAKYHISILIPEEMRNHLLDNRGLKQEVIGVEIKDPIALRLSESQVEGMGYAAVRPAMPVSQARFIPANDFHRTICRTTVDNDIFHQRIALRQNTLNRLLNEICGIKTYGNNGNMREFHRRCFLTLNTLE